MTKRILPLLFSCVLLSSIPIHLSAQEMNFAPQKETGKLMVNNRILARVNSKTISVIDVMKKMEVYLARSYPELAGSNQARYQFFSAHWRETLFQMIDHELMLADAEKLELKVSDADIRERLHERFGPNIMPTLDKLGISYDEAWAMIYSEVVVQRMSWYRINSKALHKIGPHDIKEEYKRYCAQNPPADHWKYQVLSVRAKNEEKGSQIAEKAHKTLIQESLDFPKLLENFKQNNLIDDSFTINISPEYDVVGKDLSMAHKEALISLTPGSFSAPLSQLSRIDQMMVHRIFFLKEHTKSTPPAFEDLADELYDKLVQAEIDKESAIYLQKIRNNFGVSEQQISENIPADFQPFVYR